MFADFDFIQTPGSFSKDTQAFDLLIEAIIDQFRQLLRRLSPPKEKTC